MFVYDENKQAYIKDPLAGTFAQIVQAAERCPAGIIHPGDPLNPKEKDLENTTYQFTLADGSVLQVKGNEEIEYDGETHTAANLYDALKEGYYGKF